MSAHGARAGTGAGAGTRAGAETHKNRLPNSAGRVGGHRKMPEETNLINTL